MESSSEIVKIINKIISLLIYSEEKFWLSYFQNLKKRSLNEQDDLELCRSILRTFQGGMGSLNDLVLHKKGVPLIDENNEFDKLKDELFEFCSSRIERR